MYKLYGSRGSGSAAVEMGLRACGIPYETVRASTWEADSAQAELARVNPLGQIPTLLLPDGTVMTESAAILLHLALSVPHGGLLPEAPSARALAMRGLVYIAANSYAAISVIDYPERWTTAQDAAAHAQVRDGARAQLYRSWNIFADSFPAQAFLSGEAPGALDFLATVVSRWSEARTHLAVQRPSFLALLQRIDAHPRVSPVVREHWEGA
jgi:GST-like protein